MLQSGFGRRCVEATRCPLYPRTLAQDQVCRTRRVRDYWLDRSRWQPRGFGLTAAGLLRFAGEPSLCRPRRHRVTRAVLRDLRNRLDQLAVNTARGAEIAAAAPTRSYWVIPELVAEVRFTEWTRDRRRRHPVFLCLREDKKGPEVVLDPAVGTALDRTAGDKEVSALRAQTSNAALEMRLGSERRLDRFI